MSDLPKTFETEYQLTDGHLLEFFFLFRLNITMPLE